MQDKAPRVLFVKQDRISMIVPITGRPSTNTSKTKGFDINGFDVDNFPVKVLPSNPSKNASGILWSLSLIGHPV